MTSERPGINPSAKPSGIGNSSARALLRPCVPKRSRLNGNVRYGPLADLRSLMRSVRFPQKRTCSALASMSAKCQKRTWINSRVSPPITAYPQTTSCHARPLKRAKESPAQGRASRAPSKPSVKSLVT